MRDASYAWWMPEIGVSSGPAGWQGAASCLLQPARQAGEGHGRQGEAAAGDRGRGGGEGAPIHRCIGQRHYGRRHAVLSPQRHHRLHNQDNVHDSY